MVRALPVLLALAPVAGPPQESPPERGGDRSGPRLVVESRDGSVRGLGPADVDAATLFAPDGILVRLEVLAQSCERRIEALALEAVGATRGIQELGSKVPVPSNWSQSYVTMVEREDRKTVHSPFYARLRELVGEPGLARIRGGEAYPGVRTAIAEDGDWLYFVHETQQDTEEAE